MVSEVYNIDNLIFMAGLPDNHFSLAIVDPPYGININMNMGKKKGKRRTHESKVWDKDIPPEQYFTELFRVSKNQIIWGWNYFPLPLTNAWIFWDKNVPKGVSFSDGELAWTSFNCKLKKADIAYSGFVGNEGKIHPTQKPVRLYKWLLSEYANPGDKIFDSHMGSQSSRIAAYDMGFDYCGCELDEKYFNDGCTRFDNFKSQHQIFTPRPLETQSNLL